jgi:hypothetical protein
LAFLAHVDCFRIAEPLVAVPKELAAGTLDARTTDDLVGGRIIAP